MAREKYDRIEVVNNRKPQFTIDKEQAGAVTDDAFQLGPLQLSESDKTKYASPCTAVGGNGKAIFNLNLAVTLSGDNAKADIDSLDCSLGLAPC
jgi:hypothetical protein